MKYLITLSALLLLSTPAGADESMPLFHQDHGLMVREWLPAVNSSWPQG
jgi:hypothetical protein